METGLIIRGRRRAIVNPPEPKPQPQLEGSVIVRSESMMPYINAGDFIKVELLPDKEPEFFGMIHLINTDHGPTVARIYKGSTPDTWLLKRENSEKYGDFEIRISKVTELFKVTQILRIVD